MSINEFLAVWLTNHPESRNPSAPSGQLQTSAKPQKVNRLYATKRGERPRSLAVR
jgi:hypothetical protein